MPELKFLPQVKIDETVYAWLQAKASREKRSVSMQIIWELEKIYNAEKE
jgi:hypothetical protein